MLELESETGAGKERRERRVSTCKGLRMEGSVPEKD